MLQNFATWFRTLQTLFFGLLASQAMVLMVLYVFVRPPERPDAAFFLYFVPVLLALPAVGFFVFMKKANAARSLPSLPEKLREYRAALIVQWALWEAPTFLAAVLYFFVSGHPALLGLAVLTLGAFLTRMPSRARLTNDLDLTTQEQMVLDDPKANVSA